MKLMIWIHTCILLFAGMAFSANEPQALFEAANQAYESQDFETAIDKYQQVLEEGYESADLYYNLGNAHYKLNHIAPAILQYERALVLNPRHKDARYNLRLANLRVMDNIKPVPELLVIGWLRKIFYSFSPAQWAIIAIVLMVLAAGGGTAFLLGQTPLMKRIGFFGGVALVGLSLLTVGLSLGRKQVQNNTAQGIIMSATAQVKNAPAGDQDLSILHEGVKVEVVEETGEWVRISIHAVGLELEGFVRQDQIEII